MYTHEIRNIPHRSHYAWLLCRASYTHITAPSIASAAGKRVNESTRHTPLSYGLSHAALLCVGTTCIRISSRGSTATFPALALEEYAIGMGYQESGLMIGMAFS